MRAETRRQEFCSRLHFGFESVWRIDDQKPCRRKAPFRAAVSAADVDIKANYGRNATRAQFAAESIGCCVRLERKPQQTNPGRKTTMRERKQAGRTNEFAVGFEGRIDQDSAAAFARRQESGKTLVCIAFDHTRLRER